MGNGCASAGRRPRSRSARGSVTPRLSVAEDIPWKCRRLIIGTGANGRLPVMDEVAEEAARRDVELVILPTGRAIEELGRDRKGTNAILHVTC
jgi:hypothetical protein